MFPFNKMCCGFIKELPAPSTGLEKKKISAYLPYFICLLSPSY